MFFKRPNDEAKARKAREGAARFREKGKLDKAIECYLELQTLEPKDPEWPKRAAECYRQLGRRAEAIAALDRAAELYARGGFIVKAIAVCKAALAIDPQHAGLLARVAELGHDRSLGLPRAPLHGLGTSPAAAPSRGGEEGEASRLAGGEGAPVGPSVVFTAAVMPPAPRAPVAPPGAGAAPSPAPQPPSQPAEAAGRMRSIPPGAPLEAVTLSSVAPSRTAADLLPQSVPIHELDLDVYEELDAADLLDEEAAAPATGPVAPGDDIARTTARSVLPHTPLFSELSEQTLHHLIEQVRLESVEAGDTIIHEGDAADALYIIAEGHVEVAAEGPPRIKWGELGDGDFFGEIGIVSNAPRQWTVVALEATQLLVLDRAMVSELVDREPAFLRVLLRFIRERLVERLMRTSELFAPFGEPERHELISRFRFLELDPGSVLIHEGKRSEGLFVLLSGEAEVVQGEAERVLARLAAGDVFGEMSLLTLEPAVGTVRTRTKCFALMMPQRSFTETVMAQPHVLMYTSELADRRKQANLSGRSGADSRVDLI